MWYVYDNGESIFISERMEDFMKDKEEKGCASVTDLPDILDNVRDSLIHVAFMS